MTNLQFNELDRAFRNNDFPLIENDARGIRFLKIRSMSRKATMEEFCDLNQIDIKGVNSRSYFSYIFEIDAVTETIINDFINQKYNGEREVRLANQNYLVDQLNRLQHFVWGGSFGNSLEKNIVNNYVKKIQSYNKINDEIEGTC